MAAVSAACHMARTLYTLHVLMSRVAAAELLKGTGLGASDAPASLARLLPAPTLLGLVSGPGINPQSVLDLFNVFTGVRAPGSCGPPVTLASLGEDMGLLREFTDFAVILFASLGMLAAALDQLRRRDSTPCCRSTTRVSSGMCMFFFKTSTTR